MKYCPKCDTEKADTDFYKNGTGLQSYCKKCSIETLAIRNQEKLGKVVRYAEIREPGDVLKWCPYCKRPILVDPIPDEGTCPKCDLTFGITHTFSRNTSAGKAGGIKLWVMAPKCRDIFNRVVFEGVKT